MPRIPLIENLIRGSLPAGCNLLVEFDPSSQWYNAHVTIAAAWLKTGGKVLYHISAQPPDRVRVQLKRLGVPNIDNLEDPPDSPTLALNDWYTAVIGRREQDQFAEEHNVFNSLKVADLSIWWMEGERKSSALYEKSGLPVLRIHDNVSCLSRFNEEKTWIEFVIRRIFPRATRWNQIALIGLTEGSHSESVYKTLEAMADGVIDFKLKETPEEIKDLIRIRSMRSVEFDRAWHPLKMSANTEITMEAQ